VIDGLAAIPARALLPPLRADEADRVVPPLVPAVTLALGDGLSYVAARDARGETYGVPLAGNRRARPGDGAAAALLDRMGVTVGSRAERGLTVDQTNESVVVGDEVLVKWVLHPVPGRQAAEERARLLEGFPHTPRHHGAARVDSPEGSWLIASAAAYLRGAEDGWDWAVADVRGLARGGAETGEAAANLGRIVARMHLALARGGISAAGEADATRWHDEALADARATEVTRRLAGDIEPRLESIGRCAGTPVIPIHGDLHVGQVLRTPDGALWVIDFDGSPLQSPVDRLAPQPAARDVATMLASLDHVGRVVLHRTEDLDDEQRGRVRAWMRAARSSFLTAYRQELADAGARDLLDDALLLPFLVQQECREYAYAERYLPHWRYVPDAALPDLLSEGAP
jgi:maltokinase